MPRSCMRRGHGGVSTMLARGSGAFAPLPWLAMSLTFFSSFKQRSKRVCAHVVSKNGFVQRVCVSCSFRLFIFQKAPRPSSCITHKKVELHMFHISISNFLSANLLVYTHDTSTRTTRYLVCTDTCTSIRHEITSQPSQSKRGERAPARRKRVVSFRYVGTDRSPAGGASACE